MSAALTAGRPMSVLVVDDLEDAAESLALLLNLQGFSAHAVTSGEDALVDATADPPDVIILDIWMPVMDGYEVVRRLRARQGWENPYLIAITGCGQASDRERTAAAGIDLHLVKPADPVNRTIAKSPTSAGQEVNGLVDVPVERIGLSFEWLARRAGVEHPQRAHGPTEQGREPLGQPGAATRVAVFVPPAILLVVQIVLHRPMTTNQPKEPRRGHQGRVQAGRKVSGLTRPGSVGPSGASVHTQDCPQTGELQRLTCVLGRRRIAPDVPGLDRTTLFSRVVAFAVSGVASANAVRIVS